MDSGNRIAEFDGVMKHFSTAMLVTHTDRGLHARPMHIVKVGAKFTLLLVVSNHSSNHYLLRLEATTASGSQARKALRKTKT